MSDRHSPLVSIITVNYNQLQVTCDLLDALRQITFEDYEIILVDNASKENPTHFLNENYPEVITIRSEVNLGFAGGNNLGVEKSKGQFLFFINNDTIPTEGLIETLLEQFDQIPNLGMVSPMIYYYEQQDQQKLIQYVGATPVHPMTARNTIVGEKTIDRGQFTEVKPTAYAHGAAMMIPRKIVEKVGMMSEYFFLYYEELDWCAFIQKAGYSIYVVPQAKIFHRESVSVGPSSPLKTYYLTRNRILFVRRHMTKLQNLLFTLFLVAFTIPKWTLVYLCKGQLKQLNAFYRGVFWNLKNPARLKGNDHRKVSPLAEHKRSGALSTHEKTDKI